MRVPPVSATRQSFAGELTAPVGRNRRPPISAGCRRVSLFLLPSLRACRKCLAPERFCLPFCPLPGVAACNPVVFFAARVALVRRRRLARRGGAGYVSAPHREGRRISRLCFHERSWPLPVLILPRKLRLVFRPLFDAAEKLARPARPACLAAEADSRASKKAGKTGFPALFDERRPSAALRSEFSEFRPLAPAAISAGPAGRRTHAVRMVCAACRGIPAGAASAPTT